MQDKVISDKTIERRSRRQVFNNDPNRRKRLELKKYTDLKKTAIDSLLKFGSQIESASEARKVLEIAKEAEFELRKELDINREQRELEENPEEAFVDILESIKDDLRTIGYVFEEEENEPGNTEERTPLGTPGSAIPGGQKTQEVPDRPGWQIPTEKEDVVRPDQIHLQRVRLHEGPPPHPCEEIDAGEALPARSGDAVLEDETSGDGEESSGDVV